MTYIAPDYQCEARLFKTFVSGKASTDEITKPLLTQLPGPKCEALDVCADENVMVVIEFQTEILGVDVDEFVHGPIVGL